MPGLWWTVAGGSVAVLAAALIAVGAHHEIAWRIRQRRRKHIEITFGGRRL